MKVKFDETGPLLILYAEDGRDCSCQIEETMIDVRHAIDDTSYDTVWNDVCQGVFGSWLFRGKGFTATNHTIFYYRSRFNLLHKMQRSHFKFVAGKANLEFGRIDKLLGEKHGEQLKLIVDRS